MLWAQEGDGIKQQGDAEKRFFVQGLWLKWQEKVLPSAKAFHDALHQARAAEQQIKQFSSLHRSGSATKLSSNAKPMASARTQKTSVTFQRENRLAKQDTVPKKSSVRPML